MLSAALFTRVRGKPNEALPYSRIDRDPQMDSTQLVRNFGAVSQKQMSRSLPSLQGSGIMWKRMWGELEAIDESKGTASSRHTGLRHTELPETVTEHTRPAQVQTTQTPSSEWSKWTKSCC